MGGYFSSTDWKIRKIILSGFLAWAVLFLLDETRLPKWQYNLLLVQIVVLLTLWNVNRRTRVALPED